jgi:hypothetical protein
VQEALGFLGVCNSCWNTQLQQETKYMFPTACQPSRIKHQLRETLHVAPVISQARYTQRVRSQLDLGLARCHTVEVAIEEATTITITVLEDIKVWVQLLGLGMQVY